MTKCPHCHTEVLPGAVFCEQCGKPLSQAASAAVTASIEAPAEPKAVSNDKPNSGSLKDRIAFLGGPIRQMRAKLPTLSSFRRKKSPEEQPNEERLQDSKPQRKSRRIFNIIISLLTGAAIIGFWIWLLMRKTASKMLSLLRF